MALQIMKDELKKILKQNLYTLKQIKDVNDCVGIPKTLQRMNSLDIKMTDSKERKMI